MPVGGVVYILEQIFDCRKGHIWCFHASTPILSSIPSSTKPWKINVFRHFNIVKNHQKHFQNPLKPLKNKASIELDQKSQNFLKNLHKISKKSLYKFLFFLSKIRHFIILTKSKKHLSTELTYLQCKKSKWRIYKCNQKLIIFQMEEIIWKYKKYGKIFKDMKDCIK